MRLKKGVFLDPYLDEVWSSRFLRVSAVFEKIHPLKGQALVPPSFPPRSRYEHPAHFSPARRH